MSNQLSTAISKATGTKSKTGTSKLNPAYYNRENKQFMHDMLHHDDAAVRVAAVSNLHVATSKLVGALVVEQDKTVLAAILRNKQLPVKTIVAFCEQDERSGMFSEDEEMIAFLVNRVNPTR